VVVARATPKNGARPNHGRRLWTRPVCWGFAVEKPRAPAGVYGAPGRMPLTATAAVDRPSTAGNECLRTGRSGPEKYFMNTFCLKYPPILFFNTSVLQSCRGNGPCPGKKDCARLAFVNNCNPKTIDWLHSYPVSCPHAIAFARLGTLPAPWHALFCCCVAPAQRQDSLRVAHKVKDHGLPRRFAPRNDGDRRRASLQPSRPLGGRRPAHSAK
jgi:hypothetical protein